MNLKKQISKFRSEILVGQYQSAISIAKSIMAQLEVLMALKIIKDDRLFNYIQEEYEKCLSIKNFIHNKIRTGVDQGVKKWGNKQATKWKKKQEPIKLETTLQKEIREKENQKEMADSPIKILINQSYVDLLEKIEREIMMPIKMPTFFKPTNQFRLIVISQQSYANILTYFIQNDFMSIEYEAFQSQFSKSEEENYFYENNITEILIDCKFMPREQIDLSRQKRNLSKKVVVNCIFISISQKNDYLIL